MHEVLTDFKIALTQEGLKFCQKVMYLKTIYQRVILPNNLKKDVQIEYRKR